MKKSKTKKEWKKMNRHKTKDNKDKLMEKEKALNKFIENSKKRREALELQVEQDHDRQAIRRVSAFAVIFFAIAMLVTFCVQKYIGTNMPAALQSEEMLYGR